MSMYSPPSPQSGTHSRPLSGSIGTRTTMSSRESSLSSPAYTPPQARLSQPRVSYAAAPPIPREAYHSFPGMVSSSYVGVEEAMSVPGIEGKRSQSGMRHMARRLLSALVAPLLWPVRLLRKRRRMRESVGPAFVFGGSQQQRPTSSIRLTLPPEDDSEDDVEHAAQNAAGTTQMLVPTSPAPVTEVDLGSPGNLVRDRAVNGTGDAQRMSSIRSGPSVRSRPGRSRSPSRSQSRRSRSENTRETTVANHHDPSTNTARQPAEARNSSARISIAPPFIRIPMPSVYKESSRSSKATSSISHRSSLIHLVTRMGRAIAVLYHMPWIAGSHSRITEDFVPAFTSARSKYLIRPHGVPLGRSGAGQTLRGTPPQVPQADYFAASAVSGLSESQSWYFPSQKQLSYKERSHNSDHHRYQHTHSTHRDPGPHVRSNIQQRDSSRANVLQHQASAAGLPVYAVGPNETTSPFGSQASPFPFGVQPMYFVTPPPPVAGQPNNAINVAPVTRSRTGSTRSAHTARPSTTQLQGSGPALNQTSARPQQQPGAGVPPMYFIPAYMSPGSTAAVPLPSALPPSYSHMFSAPYQYPHTWVPQQSPQYQQSLQPVPQQPLQPILQQQ